MDDIATILLKTNTIVTMKISKFLVSKFSFLIYSIRV